MFLWYKANDLSIYLNDYAQHQFVFSPSELNVLRTTIGNFDQAVILNALSYFTPSNIRLKVISKGVNVNRTCAFYEAKYSVEKISNFAF